MARTTVVPTIDAALQVRQDSEPYFIVTLSITRVSTTFTATITLGGEITIDPGLQADPVTVTSIQPPPSTLITVTPFVSSTTAAANISFVIPAPSTDQSSTATVAAIIGSILGALGVILILWLCFYVRRSRRPKFFRPLSARRRTRHFADEEIIVEERRQRVRYFGPGPPRDQPLRNQPLRNARPDVRDVDLDAF